MIQRTKTEFRTMWRPEKTVKENAEILGWPPKKAQTYAIRQGLSYVSVKKRSKIRPALDGYVYKQLVTALKRLRVEPLARP